MNADEMMLRRPEVLRLTGIKSYPKVCALMDAEEAKREGRTPFPRPYTIPGMKWVAWKRTEVVAWIDRNTVRTVPEAFRPVRPV